MNSFKYVKKGFFVLLSILMCFITIHSAAAIDSSNFTYYYVFNNTYTSSTTVIDLADNLNITDTGASLDSADSLYTFDGTDYMQQDSSTNPGTAFSYGIWFKSSDAVQNKDIVNRRGSAGVRHVQTQLRANGSVAMFYGTCANSYLSAKYSGSAYNDGDWHFLTYNQNGDTVDVYVDDVRVIRDTTAGKTSCGVVTTLGASDDGAGTPTFIGDLSGFWVINDFLGESEIASIYDNGRAYNYFLPIPDVNITHFLESVSVVRQTTNVLINSSSFVNVVNGSFYLDNSSSVYPAFTINALASAGEELTCRVLVDGVVYDSSVSRSFSSDEVGSLYSVSGVANLSTGTHYATLQCLRNNQPVLIFDSVGIVHVLSNNEGDPINFVNDSFYEPLSSSSFSLLDSFSFTTNEVASNLSRVAVLNSEVVTDYVSAADFEFYASLSGNDTAVIERVGGAGASGSDALIGIFENLSQNTTYNLSFYGRSSSNDGFLNVSFVLKEFLLNSTEFNSSVLGGSAAVSGSWVNISSLDISNLEHAFSDFVLKSVVSGSVLDASAVLEFRFLVNGAPTTSKVRSFSGDRGVLIIQDALEDVVFGNYSIALQARSLSGSETFDYNGSFISYVAEDIDFSDVFYLVNASNTYTNEQIFSFNVTDESGSVFQSNASGVATVIPNAAFEDLDVSSDGFITKTYNNHNVATDLEAFLVPTFFFDTVFFNNLTNYSGFNYTRTLGYKVQYSCAVGSSGTVRLFENDSLEDSFSTTCNGNLINTSGSYLGSSEGLKNVSFNWSLNDEFFSGQLFVFDLVDPIVLSDWGTTRGFNSNNISGWFSCSDDVSPVASLQSYWNDGLFFNDTSISLPANESFANVSQNNINTLFVSCADLVGGLTTRNDSKVVFSPSFLLVDEQNGDAFDVNNLSSVVVYVDDNSTFIDLKAEGTNTFNFTTTAGEVLRFEYVYSDGFILNRYIDVSLTSAQNVRVCTPRDEDFQFYEKIFISSSRNTDFSTTALFADCVVLLDFTRFAYQDSYSIRTFTIDTTYRLSTLDSDGDLVFLASIDGGIEAFINLDTLEFSRNQVPVSLQPETLNIQQTGDTTMLITYNNSGESNEDLSFSIVRTDTGAIIYSEGSFPDPNGFIVFWDFSSLSNVSKVLFKATVTKTDADDRETTKSVIFDVNGRSGLINPKVAFALGFILLLFGFTFSTANASLSWLGLFLCIGVLGLLSASIWTPAVLLLGAIDIFMIVYIIILMNMQTSRAVVT